VAKESADVILLNKNLTVLKDAILEGRKNYINMLKYIKFTLALKGELVADTSVRQKVDVAAPWVLWTQEYYWPHESSNPALTPKCVRTQECGTC
ncbi:MAG: hypothetical protein Q8877_02585, partial [Sweet potato little leaf phytoplasma]|nr:hypothetical protein [Sweet potato little leaf phytoplasma]